MNFKLSLISTALLTSFSISTFAETEQAVDTNTETLEQINVQDTGIKQNGYQTTGTSVVSKAEVQYSTRQILSISFRLNY